MRAFAYSRAADVAAAVQTARQFDKVPATLAAAQFLAGGTTIIDLMKLDVMRPAEIIDINDLKDQLGLQSNSNGLRLSAFAHMAEVATDPIVMRQYPVIADSLNLAASPQIRNMATLGGNVLQRTRCNYFRDTSYGQCNKRIPGSGCAALEGVNRKHAVLGTSENCIATYAGDFAQALVALDAEVEIIGAAGPRKMRFEELHLLPGGSPHIETVLAPGDLITGFLVPAAPWTQNSLYLKVRDRASYEFALASAAVALDFRSGVINEARIALGGVATTPWRARDAEAALVGKPLNETAANEAAQIALADAVVHGQNEYKPELSRRTLVRALLQLRET